MFNHISSTSEFCIISKASIRYFKRIEVCKKSLFMAEENILLCNQIQGRYWRIDIVRTFHCCSLRERSIESYMVKDTCRRHLLLTHQRDRCFAPLAADLHCNWKRTWVPFENQFHIEQPSKITSCLVWTLNLIWFKNHVAFTWCEHFLTLIEYQAKVELNLPGHYNNDCFTS